MAPPPPFGSLFCCLFPLLSCFLFLCGLQHSNFHNKTKSNTCFLSLFAFQVFLYKKCSFFQLFSFFSFCHFSIVFFVFFVFLHFLNFSMFFFFFFSFFVSFFPFLPFSIFAYRRSWSVCAVYAAVLDPVTVEAGRQRE